MKVGNLYKHERSNTFAKDHPWSKVCVYVGPAPLIRDDGVVVPNHQVLTCDGIRIVDQGFLGILKEVL